MSDEGQSLDVLNLAFAEQLYAEYVRDPALVPEAWRTYFAETTGDAAPQPDFRASPAINRRSVFNPIGGTAGVSSEYFEKMLLLQHRVDRLVRAFRVRGHMQARLDPLSEWVPHVPELDPQYYGFSYEDMNRPFFFENLHKLKRVPLREIVQELRKIYCGAIGFQFLHIDDLHMRHWIQQRIEHLEHEIILSRTKQLRILTRLTDAVVLEQFIRKKFVGAKSFSLEGGETLIPMLDLAIEKAGAQDVTEIVVGMAHRGRLNVLANIIGKSPREIFREFEDKDPGLYQGGGDVKYHMGYSSDYVTSAGKKVHLTLCFNPSHLEFVNPVALGRVRAKQDFNGDLDRSHVMPLLIHGDAAFIGEGITQETLNLCRLPGFRVGGTVHIIVNNQIGFTTQPTDSRSTMYATSVAKMLPAPIFHVNGEDPEAVARCIELALDFRHKFKMDVVIDMYCYRRLGHNESDEPSFTQPLLYSLIEKRKSVRDAYLEHLLKLGEVTREEADEISKKRYDYLEQHLSEARTRARTALSSSLEGIWKGFTGGPEPKDNDPDTGVSQRKLASLLQKLTEYPEHFTVHPKLARLLEQRREMAKGTRPLDWAAGEALALATLSAEGHRIRLCGQDSQRGTFSHRHAVLHDVQTSKTHTPLKHLSEKQGPLEIFNSALSEAGVLGFEYGYSLGCPDGLVLWEAQFGDFANAAQVIIDQFIVSGEDKWGRLSGLVLLLPHGLEGMGPEHSSARLERFLALGAEDNIQVVAPTTPAQIFHLLRRQVVRKWRKPLIVMTPKSMLRNPKAVSPLTELTTGRFQRIIGDSKGVPLTQASRVLLCSGKLYYELENQREQLGRTDVAIIRLEQLYPFPKAELEAMLSECRDGTNVIWVQEEAENMGAWRYLRVTVSMQFLGRLPFTGICRPACSSPATGSPAAHHIEQADLLNRAFSIGDSQPRPRTETVTSVKQLV
ncbi:MAG: 2-oxoglutarate dehydrogenase E1 component [Verrucomicrobiota bacterium]